MDTWHPCETGLIEHPIVAPSLARFSEALAAASYEESGDAVPDS